MLHQWRPRTRGADETRTLSYTSLRHHTFRSANQSTSRRNRPHRTPGATPGCPRKRTRCGTSDSDPFQCRRVDSFQRAPRCRCRRNIPEQRRLITQHRQICDRRAPVSDHHRQIGEHPTTIMTTIALASLVPLLSTTQTRARPVSHITKQPGTSVTDHPATIRRNLQPWTTQITIHLWSALPGTDDWNFRKLSFPYQKGISADADPPPSNPYRNIRVNPTAADAASPDRPAPHWQSAPSTTGVVVRGVGIIRLQ